jgi:hypothetical protein
MRHRVIARPRKPRRVAYNAAILLDKRDAPRFAPAEERYLDEKSGFRCSIR